MASDRDHGQWGTPHKVTASRKEMIWRHPVYQGGSEASALCSGILALEAGTSLLLYPSGPKGAALSVLLDAGDLLLFRGDCWHAGAGYACLNRRIHFYLSAPRRRREPGYTYWYTPPATAAEPLAKRARTRSGRGQDAVRTRVRGQVRRKL